MSNDKKKIRVGIFFGGKSAEHDISLVSAKNVFDALDKEKFEPVLVGIDREGKWHFHSSAKTKKNDEGDGLVIDDNDPEAALYAGGSGELIEKSSGKILNKIDAAFPVLHGTYGEDGTIQGLFELANVPYVGPGVLGSSVAMDKDAAKRLLRDSGIAVAPFKTFLKIEKELIKAPEIFNELGSPVFVKPASSGSSVGVNKADNKEGLTKAINDAFKYDNKIIIEKSIDGDEIECSVLGNERPEVSGIGRIIPKAGDFYSYEAKYLGQSGVKLEIPASIPEETAGRAQGIAINAYKALYCEGMARVDMFAAEDGLIYVNEINTIPGFTNISMYPKLWDVSGLKYKDLITKLIELSVERAKTRKSLKTTH